LVLNVTFKLSLYCTWLYMYCDSCFYVLVTWFVLQYLKVLKICSNEYISTIRRSGNFVKLKFRKEVEISCLRKAKLEALMPLSEEWGSRLEGFGLVWRALDKRGKGSQSVRNMSFKIETRKKKSRNFNFKLAKEANVSPMLLTSSGSWTKVLEKYNASSLDWIISTMLKKWLL